MKKRCFVVSAIGAPGSDERKHADLVLNYIIKPVAQKAGYEVSRAYDSRHTGMITVDTINSLLDADIVIADLSFHNPNVFYELGLRHSTKRHTIHIACEDTVLPFDNADHRAIFYDIGDWESHRRTKSRLRQLIQNLETTRVVNPVTVAEAHKNDEMLWGIIDSVSDHLDRLVERLERLTDPPPPGQITRDDFKSFTETHREQIMQVVRAIRTRIDDREIDKASKAVPHVAEFLRRLNTIEKLVGANVHPPFATQQ